MATGHYKRKPEDIAKAKERIIELRSRPDWVGFKGRKHSQEAKDAISLKNKGKTSSRKGVVLSQETKEKISKNRKGLFTGARNNKWKGGISRADSNKNWRLRNPEKVKEWRRNFHARHKKDPHYILATNLRKRILEELGRKKERKSSIEFLGCSIKELKFYLEGKFKDGMSWENHGLYGWHIDHIIPVSFFDLTQKEQLEKAFRYTNLQPLWAKENLIKSAKVNANAR